MKSFAKAICISVLFGLNVFGKSALAELTNPELLNEVHKPQIDLSELHIESFGEVYLKDSSVPGGSAWDELPVCTT